MKEIDFLPEWYRSGARRLSNYHTVYVATMGLFALMVALSFLTGRSLNTARAELEKIRELRRETSDSVHKYSQVSAAIEKLKRRRGILAQVDSHLLVSCVLGELGFLIDKSIVLNDLSIQAEPFDNNDANKSGKSSQVSKARTGRGREALLVGAVRYTVLLAGTAHDAGDVARLVQKLEESQYFCEVVPGVSRNKEEKPATDFRISCCIANFESQKPREQR